MKKSSYVMTMVLIVMITVTFFTTDAYAANNGKKGLGQIKKELENKADEMKKAAENRFNTAVGIIIDGKPSTTNTSNTLPQTTDNGYYTSDIGNTSTTNTNDNETTSTYTNDVNTTTQLYTAYDSNVDSEENVVQSNDSTVKKEDSKIQSSYSKDDSESQTQDEGQVEMTIQEDEENTNLSKNALVGAGIISNEEKAISGNANNDENVGITEEYVKYIGWLVALCIGLLIAIGLTIKAHNNAEEDFEFEDAVS